MHLATIALLCKQTTDNFRTRHPPEPRWRHLSGNRILFVPHYTSVAKYMYMTDGFQIYNVCMIASDRGKKITCPGARDKLNFRQDKHIFSPNVRRASKKLIASVLFFDRDKLFGKRISKNLDVLAQGTSENFKIFLPLHLFFKKHETDITVHHESPAASAAGWVSGRPHITWVSACDALLLHPTTPTW